jgi:hypothetical protein
MKKYSSEIEKQMQRYYQTLSEKDRRRYAAIEAIKLGHSGKRYIRELFGCDYKTIAKGIAEIRDEKILWEQRIRKQGGGAKQKTQKYTGLNEAFFRVLDKHTAGSPMDERIKWTNLTHKEIAKKLDEEGFEVSATVVKKLLKENQFRRRKALKTKSGKQCQNRDEQFRKIDWLKAIYFQKNEPILSMDSKKKNQ